MNKLCLHLPYSRQAILIALCSLIICFSQNKIFALDNNIPPLPPQIIDYNPGMIVPLQPFVALLDCQVSTQGQHITVTLVGKKFEFTLNSSNAIDNGEKIVLPVAPFLIGDTIYVPAIYLFDALKLSIKFYDDYITVQSQGKSNVLAMQVIRVADDFPKIRKKDLYIIGVDGLGSQRLFYNSEINYEFPSFSPDGTRLVYKSGPRIYIRDATSVMSRLLATAEQLYRIQGAPLFSPDGKFVIWPYEMPDLKNFRNTICKIAVIPIEGKGETRTFFGRMPTFCPDGKTIAFSAVKEGYGDYIYFMNLDGTNVREFAPGFDPHYNADGSIMVCARTYPSGTQSLVTYILAGQNTGKVYAINKDDEKEQLEYFISFTPDNQQIIFQAGERSRSGGRRLQSSLSIMNTDRSNVQPYIELGKAIGGIQITPDRSQIIYRTDELEPHLFIKNATTKSIQQYKLFDVGDFSLTTDGKHLLVFADRVEK